MTVSGVQDTAGNTIAANTRAQFFQVDGVIQRRVFNVTGGNIAAITNSAKFMNNQPDEVSYPVLFEGSVNFRDNYGTQLRGYLTPPTTGNYVFFIASDDNSSLYLSMDANPANKRLIATESIWSNTRQWGTVASGGNSDLTAKRSDQSQAASTNWPSGNTITLTAGNRYYIEAIHAEGGGGDNIAVLMQLPGDPEPVDGDLPIPGKYLSAFGVTPGPVIVTAQPTNQTATELLPVTFSVTPGGSPPYTIQWLRNGTPIPGAFGQRYTIARTALTDNQAKFSAQIFNLFSTVTSSEATLTVNKDTTPPVLLGAKGNPNLTNVVLTFSESVTFTMAPGRLARTRSSDSSVRVISATPAAGSEDRFRTVREETS